MSWGKRIIEGEEYRIKKGGSPITNPTIAVVKVRFENFIEAWTYHNTVAKRTLDYNEKNNHLRREAMKLFFSYGMRSKIHTILFLKKKEKKSARNTESFIFTGKANWTKQMSLNLIQISL